MMNEVLIIYDNAGRVLLQGTGIEEPVGVPFLYSKLEAGEFVTGVDVTTTPHTPIKVKSTSDLDSLKEQVSAINIALAEMMGV